MEEENILNVTQLQVVDKLQSEDVLFAPPQLSRDYPASDEWGMDKVQSGEALTIPLF